MNFLDNILDKFEQFLSNQLYPQTKMKNLDKMTKITLTLYFIAAVIFVTYILVLLKTIK